VDITRAALDRTRVTVVALLVVFAAGVSAYWSMPRAEDPGFVIRTAQILTLFPGASPERIEQLVTDQLEKAIQEIPELDFVVSTSRTGVSIVMVNIKESFTEMRPIWDDLRRRVDAVRPDLPDGIIGPTVNDDFGDVFGIVILVSADGYTDAELGTLADEVRDELLRVPGVARIDIYGRQEEQVYVEYSNARLAELGLSPLQLRGILDTANIIIPGGELNTDRERIILEPSGNFETLDELRRTVVSLPGRSETVYLEDLAEIRRGYVDPPRSRVTGSGRPAVAVAVSMREGGNIIELGERLTPALETLQAAYPVGVEFDVVAYQPETVDKKVREFAVNLGQAIVIVIAVMLVFLGLRTGLVVASLVPMAMVTALMIMSFAGIGIDQMSLASLIIALGMLVDNAIVMAESIMVQMQEGRSARDAAIASAAELRVPLLISSLTTAAAFLPIFLAESSTGEYTAPLFKVVTITLLSSWILALTMTPLFCVLFLKVTPATGADSSYDSVFYRTYRGTLLAVLRHPLISLAGIGVIFFLAIQGLGLVPNLFFPPSDKTTFTAEYRLPPGSSFERTAAVVTAVDRFIRDDLTAAPAGTGANGDAGRQEGVTNWASFIGQGGPRFYLSYNPEPPTPNYAFAIVNATSRDAITDELIPALERFMLDQFPDAEVELNPLQLGPPVEAPVQIRISSRDPDALFAIADDVRRELSAHPGTRNVTDDWGARSKKLVVQIDQARARRAGVTNQDIAISLQTSLSGLQGTEFRGEDDIIPVTLRASADARIDAGAVTSLNVYGQATGRSVPLGQVADVAITWEPSKILRRDRTRTVTVSSALASGYTSVDVVDALRPWLNEARAGWPLGSRYELGGEIESSVQANQAIADKMPVAMLLIVLLLIVQFNSIRRTAIILLTIPLGLIGVVIGLLLTGSYLGFMTILGVIALAGIVINNAIVLIDRINIEIDQNGHPPARAVIEAAQRRFRPILLTTATTIAGLIPLWLGGGPMWEPLAISIIFGLLFATLLTLGVVPLLYSIFFRVRFKGFGYTAEPLN